MVGLSDYVGGIASQWQMYGADADELIRAAQQGSLPAYQELMRRGEMLPQVSRRPLNRHGGPGAAPVPVAGLERPAFLDRGISRDMARPAQLPMDTGADPALAASVADRRTDMMNQDPMLAQSVFDRRAGMLPGLEQPPYLQTGMPGAGPQQPASRLSRIANGGDIAGAIQMGTAAADATAANGGNPADSPISSLAQAFMNQEDEEDPNDANIQAYIQQAMKGTDPRQARNMALAQAGFAMAASGSPFFLGAVGQGGMAGLKAYQDQQREDMINRIKAMQVAQDQSQLHETRRFHKDQTALDIARQQETHEENIRAGGRFERTQAEQERHNQQVEEDNRLMRGLQARGYDLEAQRLADARAVFEDTKARADRNEATQAELNRAEIDLRKAQAESAKALAGGRNLKDAQDAEGNLIQLDRSTGKVIPYTDDQGNKVKGQPKGSSSWAAKQAAMLAGGYTQQEIADVAAGKKKISESDAIARATAAGRAASAGEFDPTQAQLRYQEEFDRVYDMLMDPVTPSTQAAQPAAGATPSAAGPSRQVPGAGQPPVPGARKAPDGNWYVADPNRPGKYLKVE